MFIVFLSNECVGDSFFYNCGISYNVNFIKCCLPQCLPAGNKVFYTEKLLNKIESYLNNGSDDEEEANLL